MIKQIYVCECDICGAIENAKAVTWRNETEYEIPDNWVRGNNRKVCICPECSKKLNAKPAEPIKPTAPTLKFTPMYGCPVAYNEGTGVTVDPIVISVGTPKTESQVVLDSDTADTYKSSVLDCARQLKDWCQKQKNCEVCVLHNQADQDECALSTREVCDWNEDIAVVDRLIWADYRSESKAANELITYCKYKTCDSCMFYNEREQCKLTCFDVKDWDLSDVKADAVIVAELAKQDINKQFNGLKVYCDSQDSCSTCPIAYFEEKTECWQCSLTNTPVYEWQDIANKLKDEHKILAEHIEMIANYCRDDIRYCEDCRYCRSFDRCDLRLHNPADWTIYDDTNGG